MPLRKAKFDTGGHTSVALLLPAQYASRQGHGRTLDRAAVPPEDTSAKRLRVAITRPNLRGPADAASSGGSGIHLR